jgi:hypothetical protein
MSDGLRDGLLAHDAMHKLGNAIRHIGIGAIKHGKYSLRSRHFDEAPDAYSIAASD